MKKLIPRLATAGMLDFSWRRIAVRSLKLAMALTCVAASSYAGAFTVNATDDIFLSGGNIFTNAGGGVGNAPGTVFSVVGGQIVTFSGITGSWTCCNGGGPPSFNGPDGGTYGGGTNLNPTDGKIAGIIDSSDSMFLVGLFLGSSLPAVQPTRLDFSPGALTQSFLTLSPQLGQVFFIGDGLTGTGSGGTQQFVAPSGSATLYLGVADGFDFTGLPGTYGDDVGTMAGTVSASSSLGSSSTPEPSTVLLMGVGLLGLGVVRHRFPSRD